MTRKRLCRWLLGAGLVLLLLFGAFAVYTADYYHADAMAVAALQGEKTVTVTQLEDGSLVFAPEKTQAGLVFYPGAKVEETAYAPLMRACAEKGVLCVLVKMPFRLAVLRVDAADDAKARFPEITRWYVGGHSLGGAMAASYAAQNPDGLEGLILLAAYSTKDLSGTGLRVLSLYGSEDGVLNRARYAENRLNLPADTVEIVLPGGCHAGFGEYGAQKGDGSPGITAQEQLAETAGCIAAEIDFC